LLAVIKIAGNDERVDLLIDAQVDDAAEGGPGRRADQISQVLIAERQCSKRRIKMNVGSVYEAESCDRKVLRLGPEQSRAYGTLWMNP
jgi:hypothetical protein